MLGLRSRRSRRGKAEAEGPSSRGALVNPVFKSSANTAPVGASNAAPPTHEVYKVFLSGATYEVPMQPRDADYIDVADTAQCSPPNVYATPPVASVRNSPRNTGVQSPNDGQYAVFSDGRQAYSVPLEAPTDTDEATYAHPTPVNPGLCAQSDVAGHTYTLVGMGDSGEEMGDGTGEQYALFQQSGLHDTSPQPLSKTSTFHNGESQT
eukprot:m.264741 g.264741  ORF g.264741 m.264741 type:complete len:208 (+) comp16029_c0_seq7:1238-1861(+)